MLKKLDSLLLKGFVSPFIATFFIAIFVLMMQTIWLYIDDIAGKGAGVIVIAEFLFYLSIALFPMALPIAILLASVMVMGNLAERYELAAMKSAGVPLWRIMMPLLFFSIGVAIFSYFCANNFIPVANLKFKSRLYDIRKQKPTFSLEEGVFNDGFQGYAIRIGKKGSDDRSLQDVLIYDNEIANRGNLNMTLAKTGEMITTDNKRYLIMNLYDGQRNEEPTPSGNASRGNYPFVRTNFKKFQKVFDLSEFDLNRTDESLFKSHQSMLSTRQLRVAIDSIDKQIAGRKKLLDNTLQDKLSRQSGGILPTDTTAKTRLVEQLPAYLKDDTAAIRTDTAHTKGKRNIPTHILQEFDTLSTAKKRPDWKDAQPVAPTDPHSAKHIQEGLLREQQRTDANRERAKARLRKMGIAAPTTPITQQYKRPNDVIAVTPPTATTDPLLERPTQQLTRPLESYTSFLSTFEGEGRKKIAQQAATSARYVLNELKSYDDVMRIIAESRVKHVYELHTKYSMAAVCIIFMLIGAPMGAIVRKGGFGYPLLVAIIFFMLFITLLVFCKKLAESFVMPAQYAAWVPCLVLLPIGIFLTYKAMNDSNLFNIDEKVKRLTTWAKKVFRRKPAIAA